MNNEIGLASASGEMVALKSVAINGRLNGILSEIDVTQHYHNQEDTNIEAVYTFPLPIDAVLMGLNVEINGKVLTGLVKPSAIAEEQYEEAISNGDTAVMLKKISDGLYSINLGNLLAEQYAIITFRYAQLHQWQGDCLRLYIPTTLAPKYGNPQSSGLAEHEFPSHTLALNYQFDFKVTVEGRLADANITSPTHSIQLNLDVQGAQLSFTDRTQPMDRDLIVEISKPINYLGEGLWAYDGDKMLALASFYPLIHCPIDGSKRCIKMVVDCSGSMSGEAIEQARVALHEIIGQLSANDWFNIILFGSSNSSIFNQSVQANSTNLNLADKVLRSLQADLGGTEMGSALAVAYASATPKGIPADILLITDGQIWNEAQLILQAKASEHRHFVVGVGSAVSEAFLSKLATETSGASEFVTPNENMSKRIVRHFERIKQPKLYHSSISWSNNSKGIQPLLQSYQCLETIFAGDTVNAFAWFDATNGLTAELLFACDRELPPLQDIYSQNITLHERTNDNSTLVRLAAHSRLAGMNAAEATVLAAKYQLITKYTHYILVQQNDNANKLFLPKLRNIPHQLPAGHSGLGRVSAESLMLRKTTSTQASQVYSSAASGSPCMSEAIEYLETSTFLSHEFTPDNDMGISEFAIFDLEDQGEDSRVIAVLNELAQKNRAELLDNISLGKIGLDDSKLKSDEFVACVLATVDAMSLSASSSKIDALVAMFLHGCESKNLDVDGDRYLELLSIVRELSERELVILVHLYEFEQGTHSTVSDEYADEQLTYLADKLEYSPVDIKPLLIRLKRTGLILTETERDESRDIALLSGWEALYLSSLATELKGWIHRYIEAY